MQFIFAYPEANGLDVDMLDAGPLADLARAAERAGFHGMSLTEHPAPGARWLQSGGHQTLDPLVGLGFIAAATTRLRLLTHLVVGPYHNPLLLAKAAATVDKLSGGRLTLGIGAGYLKTEFFALGINFDQRNALFDELLDVLPLHWRGEPFSYHGLHFDARDVVARPRPVQNPVPLWIGGNARVSRRRAAERAQGWMPMPGGSEQSSTARTVGITDHQMLAAMTAEVQELAAVAGRGPVDIAWTYTDPTMGKDPAADADRHREELASLAAAGVTALFVSTRQRDAQATLDFLAAFGQTYIR